MTLHVDYVENPCIIILFCSKKRTTYSWFIQIKLIQNFWWWLPNSYHISLCFNMLMWSCVDNLYCIYNLIHLYQHWYVLYTSRSFADILWCQNKLCFQRHFKYLYLRSSALYESLLDSCITVTKGVPCSPPNSLSL